MKTLFSILALVELGLISSALAQGPGSAGFLFLLIQPSPRAHGMAGVSVASAESDAIAITFNPAHLGRMARDRYFAFELYPGKTNWLPQLASDLGYDAKTVLGGYNFKRLDKRIPVSLGIAYSRIFFDLGERIITGENDPTELYTFHSTERANVWSIGLGFDYLVKAGIGLSLKNIASNLAPPISNTGPRGDGHATANARDFGVVACLPIDEVVSKLTHKAFEVRPGLRPILGLGLGYSKSNIGGKITYIDATQADLLPRTARIGTSLNAGLALSKAEQAWRLVSFEQVYEAEQLLARNNRGEVSYAGLLGDINFWDNAVLRKGNSAIIAKRGWELKLFEILAIRGGHYDDPRGRVIYDTQGFGFSLHGVLKAIRYFNPKLQEEPTLKFLYNHIDIQLESSSLTAGAGHPFAGTEFQGITISVF